MNTHETVKKLKGQSVFSIAKENDAWFVTGSSHADALDAKVTELWMPDVYMLEGFIQPLSAANIQLLELAGEDTVFEFQEWNQRRLPALQQNENLRVRIISHSILQQIIQSFRAPLAAAFKPAGSMEAAEPFSLNDFWPSNRPKRVIIRKDGSLRILKS